MLPHNAALYASEYNRRYEEGQRLGMGEYAGAYATSTMQMHAAPTAMPAPLQRAAGVNVNPPDRRQGAAHGVSVNKAPKAPKARTYKKQAYRPQMGPDGKETWVLRVCFERMHGACPISVRCVCCGLSLPGCPSEQAPCACMPHHLSLSRVPQDARAHARTRSPTTAGSSSRGQPARPPRPPPRARTARRPRTRSLTTATAMAATKTATQVCVRVWVHSCVCVCVCVWRCCLFSRYGNRRRQAAV
jgi:hypothetical protein